MRQQQDVFPQALAVAEGHLRAGRLAEGIAGFQHVLALRPDLPDAWYNLGYLQRHARHFPDALTSYAQALKHGITRPEEVHLNRAAIFSEHLHDDGAAETELREAVRLNPRFLAGWLNLGNLYEDIGAVDDARRVYEQALDVAPGNGRALARLTAIDVFSGEPGNRLPVLQKALQRPGLVLDEAAEIGFALGTALDGLGRFAEAFDSFAFSNRAVRERLGAAGRYDRAAHERLVDRLIAMEPPAAAVGEPDGPEPIFICGMFRSGSTLCEHILGRHSRVTAAGELDIVPALCRELLQPYPKALTGLTAAQTAELRDVYLAQVRAVHPNAQIVSDKRPDNFLHVGLIKAMFPAAKIIHTTRHPLDNILSIFFLYFDDSVSYGSSLEDIAHWYHQYRRLMRHWKTLYGDDVHDFRYDDLVMEAGPVVDKLLAVCGLESEPLLHDGPEQRSVRTPSAWQVRKPLHHRSSGRWRNYAAYLKSLGPMPEPD